MHSRESIHELPDKREQGSVPDGECVQSSVVLDGSEITILLLDKEEGECIGGLGLVDISLFQIFGDEFLEGDVFGRGQGVHLAIHHVRGTRFQIDGVIPFA